MSHHIPMLTDQIQINEKIYNDMLLLQGGIEKLTETFTYAFHHIHPHRLSSGSNPGPGYSYVLNVLNVLK